MHPASTYMAIPRGTTNSDRSHKLKSPAHSTLLPDTADVYPTRVYTRLYTRVYTRVSGKLSDAPAARTPRSDEERPSIRKVGTCVGRL
eukprot:8945467-Pyramimonas_sp.AAC.1